MAIDLQARPGETVLISAQLADSDTGLFPQAVIYNINDLTTVIDTVNLTEISTGAYAKTWTTPDSENRYWVRITTYIDSYGGTASPIDRPTEQGINVFEVGGSNAFLFGGLQSQISKQKISLSKQDKVEIAGMVKDAISADLVNIIRKLRENEKMIDKLILQVINLPKKRYDSELSSIVNDVKNIKSDVMSVSDNISAIDTTIDFSPVNRLIIEHSDLVKDKIDSIKITKVESGSEIIEIDEDLILAKELIRNPEKLTKKTKLNKRVLDHIVWLKRLA